MISAVPQLVHPTAIIDGPDAHVGADTRIWHFVHVMPGAYIGDVRIGNGCKLQNNVSVYDGVTLEDDVFLGPSCVFTNVSHPRAHVSRKHAYERTAIGRGATVGANATIVCGIAI